MNAIASTPANVWWLAWNASATGSISNPLPLRRERFHTKMPLLDSAGSRGALSGAHVYLGRGERTGGQQGARRADCVR